MANGTCEYEPLKYNWPHVQCVTHEVDLVSVLYLCTKNRPEDYDRFLANNGYLVFHSSNSGRTVDQKWFELPQSKLSLFTFQVGRRDVG